MYCLMSCIDAFCADIAGITVNTNVTATIITVKSSDFLFIIPLLLFHVTLIVVLTLFIIVS